MTASTKRARCVDCKARDASALGRCDTCYRRFKRRAATAARRAAGETAPKRYPWDRWLDGRAHVVGLAELPSSSKAFDNQVRLAADRRGLKATVRHLPGGEIVIQTQPR